jgi:hypothetical protein
MNKAEQRHPGGRPREGKYLTCLDCSQHFYVNQKSRRKYCSDKCARDSVKKRVFDPERGLKKCAMCNEWKSTDSFQEANRRVGGHGKQAYCRPCSLIKSNEWSSKNPETKRTHRKTAYYKNPEYYREARRNLSKEEREKKNKYSAKYRAENPDKVRL